nr:hypothetical protein B0A51_00330 [Rachicladosporium sp. CCFEE 5018]
MATTTITQVELEVLPSVQHYSASAQKSDAISGVPQRSTDRSHDESPRVRPVAAVAADETRYLTGVKFWLLMLNLAAVIMLYAIDMAIVATAVPAITDHFHTVADIGWYSVAFRLSQCGFQFVYGKAYKLFPIKNVFLIANAFSFIGSLLCGAATSSSMLVAGRAIAGIGTAGLGAGSNAMLIHSVPLRRRPTFLGLWAAIEGTSAVLAPLLGGALTQSAGWRWCFYISLPLGGATLLLTYALFSEAPKKSEVARLTTKSKLMQLDPISNVILVSSLISLFFALNWAGTKYAWNSGTVIGLLVTSVVLAALFGYRQYQQGEKAVLAPRILKSRVVLTSLLFITLFNSAQNVLEWYLPTYYQVVHGYTPAQSGLLMLPILIAATIGAIGSGTLMSVVGYYAPFMVFASVTMPVAAGLITTLQIDTSLAKLIFYTALIGLGYGIGSVGPTVAVQTVLSDADATLGIAVLMFGSSLGPAITIAIAQVIFTSELSKNLGGLGSSVNGTSIESNGLTQLLTQAPASQRHDVVEGIDKSITHTWYLVVALACLMAFGGFGAEWRSLKKDDPAESTTARREGLTTADIGGLQSHDT